MHDSVFENYQRMENSIALGKVKDNRTWFVQLRDGLKMNGWRNCWLEVPRGNVALFSCGSLFTIQCPLAYRRRVIGFPHSQQVFHLCVFADRILAISDVSGLATTRLKWDKSILFSAIQLVAEEGCSVAAQLEGLNNG